jgi:hypothetical protein
MTASSYKVGTIELQFILGAVLVKPGLSVPGMQALVKLQVPRRSLRKEWRRVDTAARSTQQKPSSKLSDCLRSSQRSSTRSKSPSWRPVVLPVAALPPR